MSRKPKGEEEWLCPSCAHDLRDRAEKAERDLANIKGMILAMRREAAPKKDPPPTPDYDAPG